MWIQGRGARKVLLGLGVISLLEEKITQKKVDIRTAGRGLVGFVEMFLGLWEGMGFERGDCALEFLARLRRNLGVGDV